MTNQLFRSYWPRETGIESGDVSHGAAISLFMLPVLLIVTILMLRFIRRREV